MIEYVKNFYGTLRTPNHVKRKHANRSCYAPHYGKNAARRNRVQAELLKEKKQVREEAVRLKDGSVHLWASDEMYALAP